MKRSIPQLPPTMDPQEKRVMQAIKENLETITGQRTGPIANLPPDATLVDVINKVNEIIDRLQ